MIAYVPPALFVISWICALLGREAPGTSSATPFDENALSWMLFLGMGWSILGGSVSHTIFAKQTAQAIGWQMKAGTTPVSPENRKVVDYLQLPGSRGEAEGPVEAAQLKRSDHRTN